MRPRDIAVGRELELPVVGPDIIQAKYCKWSPSLSGTILSTDLEVNAESHQGGFSPK